MAAVQIEWYRIPVDKGTLKSFTEKSDLKGFLQAGSFLLVFIATTSISFYFFWRHLWVPMVIFCYLHSVFHQMVGMSAAVHELNHGTVFKTRRINEFFYKLFCFLTWNNPVHFRASHALHHQYTVFREIDKEVIQEPVKLTMNWGNYISWFTFDYAWFWTLIRANVLPSYVALIVLFSVTHLCALQHMGLDENVPDWRMVCHTVKVHPVVGWLYWHMNYHIEHHMYAAVPCYNLAKFHDAIKDQLPEGPNGFIQGLKLVGEIKKRQEEDPEYVYVPRFPPTATPPKTG